MLVRLGRSDKEWRGAYWSPTRGRQRTGAVQWSMVYIRRDEECLENCVERRDTLDRRDWGGA